MKLRTMIPLLAAGATTILVVAGLAGAAGNPPVNTSLPTITGKTEQGSTLTGHHGTWTGDSPITYKWQWKRCNAFGNNCANITGEASQAIVLKAADVGFKLRINVTATNGAGTAVAESNASTLVQPRGGTTTTTPTPTPATGCPSGSGPVDVAGVSSPARLLIDGQQATPSVITRSTTDLTVRFHVSACNGRSVGGALVYATAVPFQQFSIPAETPTGADGWATMTMHVDSGFPASAKQQILAMFIRARKSGENTLGGISTRRLVSFRVNLNG
jgi:hypothetical protein